MEKAAAAVFTERAVFRHRAVEAEVAEPAVAQVEVHLGAELTLGAQAIEVADQQHADHQLGIACSAKRQIRNLHSGLPWPTRVCPS